MTQEQTSTRGRSECIIACDEFGRPHDYGHDLHRDELHPKFEYRTTRGPRKLWESENTPPDGEGWTRNIHRGHNGWCRFEYHEEAYWMRRLPVTRFNPATDSPETAKQMAAVMLMHGTEDQQRQALSTMNGAPDA